MEQQDPLLRFLPEGVETGILLALMGLALVIVVRLMSRKRWAVCFTSMLITWVFGSAIAIPILGFGSHLIGPAAILLCLPVAYVAAFVSSAGITDLTPGRRHTLAGAMAAVLTAFGFAVFVLPATRTADRPVQTREYGECYQHMVTLGKALNAYAIDHAGQYPRLDDARGELCAPRGSRGPYLKDPSALECPAINRVRLIQEPNPLRLLGSYTYAPPSRRDPEDTYVMRCRRHTHVRRFWTERVGFYLRKDGKIDVIPLAMPQ